MSAVDPMSTPDPIQAANGHSLTHSPITRTLLSFSLPILLTLALHSLNGAVNALWVGSFLGPVGLAATANANLIVILIFSTMIGFCTAVSILISQHMGRGDIDASRRVVGTGAALFLSLSIVLTIVGWIEAPTLLRWMDTPAEVRGPALSYLRVMFLNLPFSIFSLFLTQVLRGMGDSVTPLRCAVPGIVIEVLVNPLLIHGYGPVPALGTAGSALTTLLASSCATVLLVRSIYRRDLVIRLRGREFAYLYPSWELLYFTLSRGVPLGLQMVVFSGSSLLMMGLINQHGTVTAAAFGAINQIWIFVQMPANAVSLAVSTMAAQNIGAGRWERVSRLVRIGAAVNVASTALVVCGAMLLDQHLLRLFLPDNEAAVAIAQRINIVGGWGFVIQSATLTLSAVMRANGVALVPLIFMFIAFGPGRVGSAMLLQGTMGVDAIWLSFPIGSIMSFAMNAAYFRLGTWRKARFITGIKDEPAAEPLTAAV